MAIKDHLRYAIFVVILLGSFFTVFSAIFGFSPLILEIMGGATGYVALMAISLHIFITIPSYQVTPVKRIVALLKDEMELEKLLQEQSPDIKTAVEKASLLSADECMQIVKKEYKSNGMFFFKKESPEIEQARNALIQAVTPSGS